MRFMLIIKSDPQTEAGAPPSAELVAAMGRYNESMVRAGVLLAGEGLLPTSRGVRVKFEGGVRTVKEGPFAEPGLVAGFWLIETKSRAEAIEWVKRCPFDGGAEVELRQVAEASDFPREVFPDEEVAREAALREELRRRAG